ncbi:GILT-like protein 1 [Chrysoperla carnea]|uniref:GILT-like protein 1 n=1 Tax=Chrysoperla carnea TaxID=189513 RepID=UPI001D097380|nr:GILT-like protein 1 [Chrysoperla carnea]
MFLKIYFCVLITLFVTITSTSAKKPTVSVYYEALCYDSQQFYTKQFYPTYIKLGAYFNVDLLPYGKATHSNQTGKWVFNCQHGPNECFANTVQACVLHDEKASEEQKLKFINCVLSDSNPTYAGSKCGKESDLYWATIDTCSKTEEGANYLAQYGDRTHAVRPNISFVPTIIFNSVYNQELQNKALKNFEEVLCSQLSEPKPAECGKFV